MTILAFPTVSEYPAVRRQPCATKRAATANGNQHNQRAAQRGNRCGLLGVSVHARGGFYSRIAVNGRSRYLGYFATAQEAHQAYVAAKRELHPTGTL